MDSVEVRGLQIGFRRAGSGHPLVLLHSGLSDSREWRHQLDELSDTYDVIAPDLPGSGQSSDPPAGFTLADYAGVLADLMAELGVTRAHVAGLSFGATYALVLQRFYPGFPTALVLASAYAGWAGSLPPDEVQRRTTKVLSVLDRPDDHWIDEFLATLFEQDVPAEVLAESRAIVSDVHLEGARQLVLAFGNVDLRDVLPTISVPTLLLYGDRDRRSPLGVATELHAQIPGSRLVLLPGVGHASNVEAPDRFNTEVKTFLADVEGLGA
jgi:pimeloyl-ACP methyl ester carboxylesterase